MESNLFETLLFAGLLFSQCGDGGTATCSEELNLTPVLEYSDRKLNGMARKSKTVDNRAKCISHCFLQEGTVSMIFDPVHQLCTCHSLPLSSLTLGAAPGAMAFGAKDLPTGVVDTWVTRVIGESSHFKSLIYSYPASRMIGAPNYYPKYGNTNKAWCPGKRNADQFVELGIAEAIFITEIHIYEVFWAGGVEAVSVRDSNSNWVVLWRTTNLQTIKNSRIFTPEFLTPAFKSDAIRIDLDLGTTNVWSEFDAMRVVGTRNRTRIFDLL
ncbi:F-box/LRR-repeat protein 4-like [Haliotis cracherodii]|uniref:F-box/LRR-repeat protein 4-like n=1 Tax=Haliotis cracherodii TaxID=6455 RepID=UPI0039ED2EAD